MQEIINEKDKREKEQKEQAIRAVLSAVENNFARAQRIKDPVTRNIVFLEKLLTVGDICIGGLNTYGIDFPEDLKLRSENITKVINTQIEGLIDWIQQPIYSPDHFLGNMMMKKVRKVLIHVLDHLERVMVYMISNLISIRY